MTQVNDESQYIYKDVQRNEKARLVRTDKDWYVCECKSIDESRPHWTPFVCGTEAFLMLTDRDKEWAIDKRRTK